MAAHQPFGKGTNPTSYDGLTIAQRQKAKRYAVLKAADKKNQDERRYDRLVQEVRRMSIWKHLGESNLTAAIDDRGR
jgi:hypothetical protein